MKLINQYSIQLLFLHFQDVTITSEIILAKPPKCSRVKMGTGQFFKGRDGYLPGTQKIPGITLPPTKETYGAQGKPREECTLEKARQSLLLTQMEFPKKNFPWK